MSPIRAGSLRHRGVIEQPTETQSASGQPTVTWSTFATRWCGIEPVSGREYFAARQTTSEATHAVTMRYTPGVTTAMRFVVAAGPFAGNYDIESATPNARGTETQLVCVLRPALVTVPPAEEA